MIRVLESATTWLFRGISVLALILSVAHSYDAFVFVITGGLSIAAAVAANENEELIKKEQDNE